MLRALEKQTAKGVAYTRPPAVAAAIEAALAQDLSTVTERAKIRNPEAPDYLRSECLVYLIRHARRHGDEKTMNALLPLLLARCSANLLAKVPTSQISTADNLREEILNDFVELFAVDSSPKDRHGLDFFEVRFNSAFRSFRIDRVRAECMRLNKSSFLPETDEDMAGMESNLDQDMLARLKAELDLDEGAFRKEVAAAIMDLPDEERSAFILCIRMGFQEESLTDPRKVTAATLCGVSGRTIRKRLARAIAKLAKLYKEAA